MYTRALFGKELKEKLTQQQKIREIASWAYDVYLGKLDDNDVEFLNILLILNCMDNGEEFEISYKRLNEIANDLIDGKTNIDMGY